MLFHITKNYRKSDMEIILRAIRRKHGRIEKVKKLLQVKKCAQPEIGEAFLYYLASDDNIVEEVIIEDRKVLNALTAKRFELIEFLNKNGPMPIKELAERVGRDYKNVYDDISALNRYFILNSIRYGRESVPVGVIESVEIKV